MAVGELVVSIIGDMQGLSKTFQQVNTDLGKVGKGIQETGKSLSDVGGAMTTGITAPIIAVTAGFGVVAKEAMDFEKGMSQVFTLIPNMSKEGMDSMTEDVLNFSKEMGVTTDEVIPALYDAIGSGVPEENVFSFLEVAQKGSVAAATDLGTAVNGLTSIINAYGAENLDAAKASDVLFTGINVGKMTYEELSKSLYEVIPTAASLGVSLEDVTAALATMTAQGTPTSVATSQLRQLFVELSKEGTVASDTFKELSGKSFYEFIQSGGTVQEAIQILSDGMTQAVPDAKELQDAMFELAEPTSGLAQEFEALTGKSFKDFQREGGTAEEALDILGVTFGDTKERVSDYFGSVEAGNAILSLTGQGSDIFNNALIEIGNSAGATEKAYQTMADTTSKSTDELKASFQLMAVEIGSQVLPVLNDTLVPLFQDTIVPAMEKIIPVIGDILEAFNELPQPIKIGVLAFVALLAALGPIIVVIGSVVSAVGTIAAAFGTGGVLAGAMTFVTATLIPALVSALGLILSPIGLVVAAVAALYIAWRNNWFGIRDIANTVWEGLKTAANNLVTGLSNAYNQIPARITVLKGQMSSAWNDIVNLHNTIKTALVNAVTGLYNGLVSVYNSIIASMNNLRTQISAVWTQITTVYTNARTSLVNIINALNSALSATYNAIRAAASTLYNGLLAVWNQIRASTTTFSTGLQSILSNLYSRAQAIFNQIRAAASSFNSALNAVWSQIRAATTMFSNNIQSTLSNLLSSARNIFNQIVSALSALYNSWRNTWNQILNFLISVASNIVTRVRDIPTAIRSALSVNLYSVGANMIGTLRDGVMNGLNSLYNSVVEQINKIKNYISNAQSSISNTISKLSSSSAQSLSKAASNAVSSAGQKVKVSLADAEKGISRLLPHSPAEEGPFKKLPNWDAVFLDPMIKSIAGVNKLSNPLSRALSNIRSPIDGKVSSGLNNISNVSNSSSYSYGGDTLNIEHVTISNGMDLQAIFTQFEQFTANKRRARGYI